MTLVTENTLELQPVFERIQEEVADGGSHWFSVAPKRPRKAQALLRAWLRRTDYGHRVVISVREEDGIMIVSVKAEPYHKRLEALLGECLAHIDDENLYDRIMEALYGKQKRQI